MNKLLALWYRWRLYRCKRALASLTAKQDVVVTLIKEYHDVSWAGRWVEIAGKMAELDCDISHYVGQIVKWSKRKG